MEYQKPAGPSENLIWRWKSNHNCSLLSMVHKPPCLCYNSIQAPTDCSKAALMSFKDGEQRENNLATGQAESLWQSREQNLGLSIHISKP